MKAGKVSFDEIKLDSNRNNVRTAALYYAKEMGNDTLAKQKYNINKALVLYNKLAESDTGSLKINDLEDSRALLRRLNRLESDSIKRNQNYHSIVQILNEIVAIKKTLLETDPANSDLRYSLANSYNSLAFNKLFVKDFISVIQVGLEGLKIDSSYDIAYTNLAVAYLLTNQNKLAHEIYLKYKDKDINYVNMSFKEGFLQDFENLTNARVISPNDKRVERIKDLLK